MIYKSGEVD